MIELVLEDQGLHTFLQLKTSIVTKKILGGDNQVPKGVTAESYGMANSKFKATVFEKHATMKKLSHIWKGLQKLSSVTIQSCSTRIEEINELLKHFLRTEIIPLSEGDLIEIIVNMVPVQWCKSMIQINFEHIPKTLTVVVEYLEYLDVLDAQKKGNSNPENETKSKSKGYRTGR